MKPRERVIAAIQREEFDRIPLDCAFRPEVWTRLRQYFRAHDEEIVKKELGVDIREVGMDAPTGFKPTSFIPSGSKNYESFLITAFDEWGIRRKEGATGIYWHFTYHPLEDISLDEYEFPDLNAEGRFDRAKKEAKSFGQEYAVASHYTGGIFEQAWWLRGFNRFIRDLYGNPKFANDLLDRLLDWKTEQGKRIVETGVDIIKVGDDFGTQTGMMIPPELWRRYFKHRYKRWFSDLKSAGDVYVFFHSDGKIDPIIPDLIEVGVDILNPIQPECMDPAKLKKEYGDKLTFHGTVSVQETLPFGTVEDVREEVITRIRTLGYDGGLIVSPTHMVGTDVPIENILALYETAREYQHVERNREGKSRP